MVKRGVGPDFVEALARGLDVLAAFDEDHRRMTLTEIARRTGLARPTARRLLLTLAELGYVRTDEGMLSLTSRVLRLGMACASSLAPCDAALPHLQALADAGGESVQLGRLEGSDVVYLARVSVPRMVTSRVEVGTLFPAWRTALGKVLLAHLDPDRRAAALAEPSRSTLTSVPPPDVAGVEAEAATVRQRGWALADEELAPGLRAVAVPVPDRDGTVESALSVTVHAAETSVQTLIEDHLPLLLRSAASIAADWALQRTKPHVELRLEHPARRPAIAANGA